MQSSCDAVRAEGMTRQVRTELFPILPIFSDYSEKKGEIQSNNKADLSVRNVADRCRRDCNMILPELRLIEPIINRIKNS